MGCTLAKRKKKTMPSQQQPITLLLVEGETEDIFWNRVKAEKLADCRVIIKSLKGIFNVNRKVMRELVVTEESEKYFVYCCLDLDTRDAKIPPGFDLKFIRKTVKEKNWPHIHSVDLIPANQEIESWFYYDIQSVFNFLGVPKSKQKPRRHLPPEKNSKEDLKRLFREHGKMYREGYRAKSLINALDIAKICEKCKELKEGIALILKNNTQ